MSLWCGFMIWSLWVPGEPLWASQNYPHSFLVIYCKTRGKRQPFPNKIPLVICSRVSQVYIHAQVKKISSEGTQAIVMGCECESVYIQLNTTKCPFQWVCAMIVAANGNWRIGRQPLTAAVIIIGQSPRVGELLLMLSLTTFQLSSVKLFVYVELRAPVAEVF